MPKYEFEVETVKKRLVGIEAKSLEGARQRLNELTGDEWTDDWDLVYKSDIIEDERIVEIRHEGKALIKKGEVVWRD